MILETIARFLCGDTIKKEKYMKACEIYKTSKELKIATMYKTDAGWYISDEPVFILSIDSSKEELLESISQAISASKLINNPSNYSSKLLLQKLKEKSFKTLYQSSVSCSLYIEDNNAKIEPMIYSEKYKCLEPDENRVIKLQNFTKDELMNEIYKILEL